MQIDHSRETPERHREHALLFFGPAYFQALVAAKRLGLFAYLHRNPRCSEQSIATALALPPYSVRTLLMACVALKCVRRDKEGLLRNAQWADSAFCDQSETFDALIEACAQILYTPFEQMTEALREGRNVGLSTLPGEGNTLYERLTHDPEKEALFHRWMSGLSAAGLPLRLLDELADTQHVLDVGGGDATNAVQMAQRHPHLQVTIMDLPSVCERARERIEQEQLSDRIHVHPGDIREGQFDIGVDAVLFSRIFNIYGEAQNQRFVQAAADALPRGGKLLIFPSSVASDSGFGPLSAAFLSLYYLCVATGEGRVYAPYEYQAWFANAGFRHFRSHVDKHDEAVIVGVL